MRLYGYWRSSATWRVRIGLNLKGVAHEIVPVHLVKDGGEQKLPAHLGRNPMAQVPVLEVPGADGPVYLSQSVAILEYLDEVLPTPALLPADPVARARARMLVEIVNSGVQPLQNLSVTRRLDELGVDSGAWVRAFVSKGMDALAAAAASTAGTFLLGDTPTIADCFLVPQLYSCRRFGLDTAAWPLLARVEEAAYQLPAFQAAHADRQPDAVA